MRVPIPTHRRSGRVKGPAFGPLALPALSLLLACSHAPGARKPWAQGGAGAPGPALSGSEASSASRDLSADARQVLRSEGELLWTRYTAGTGPLPATAAEARADLFTGQALGVVAAARDAGAEGSEERRARELLHAWIAPQAVTRAAAAEVEALDKARAALTFAAPGEATASRGERDLDRLLSDEPDAKRRAALAENEAKAAAALAPLALARDQAELRAMEQLGLGGFAPLAQEELGATPAALAALAEQTLAVTQDAAARAVAMLASQNLGLTADRVRRADLPRMLRTVTADGEFQAGRGWELARATLAGLDLDPEGPRAPRIALDAKASPAKALRPLALLIDPPSDVRLSFQPAGGVDQQRALLHESARAVGGALTQARTWELAQLGDGSAAEGVAQLFEQLAGDPVWLRAATQLRGQPLDELVHASAARRLLTARRAAALVLFEVKRREQPQTAEAAASLYRGLLQRATLALYSDADAGRWPLETDTWLRAAVALRAALFAALLEQQFAALAPGKPAAAAPAAQASPAAAKASDGSASSSPPSAGSAAKAAVPALEAPAWLRSPEVAARLRAIWRGGRSLRAEEAAALTGNRLDPAALAQVVEAALAYTAPDPRPAAQRPDYRYMQGDKRKVRRHKRRKR